MFRKLAFVSALAVSSAPILATAAPAAIVETAPVAAPVAAQGEANRYAEREAAAPEAAQYEGGNTVVIGISGGALLVLLFLLLII